MAAVTPPPTPAPLAHSPSTAREQRRSSPREGSVYQKVAMAVDACETNGMETGVPPASPPATRKAQIVGRKEGTMKSKAVFAAGLVLLIPLFLWLLAIWRWRPGALVLAFVLLFGGAGLAYQLLVARELSNKAYRFAVGLAFAAVLMLAWMNAAVGGILGDDPANMMYFGVLLVGFAGAVIARLEPQGMSRALFATAFAMALVPAIALIIGTPA